MSDHTKASTVTLLSQYIGKTLRIHTTDHRAFVGQMKCTDNECNVILALANEYRIPSSDIEAAGLDRNAAGEVRLTSRYVGLIVVPGKFITKIEHEFYVPPGQQGTS